MKRTILLTWCLGLIGLLGNAQNLLKADWKFAKGDDPTWSGPEVDDSAWATLKSGQVWEDQGIGQYDGFAWYRQKVFVPAELKGSAETLGGLVLELGKIDDSDETFWNGRQIGATGSMPPDYVGAYDAERIYTIPFESINFGADNWIAVRVYDHLGGGGMYKPGTSLHVPGIKELLRVEVGGLPEDHIFGANERIGYTINLENGFSEDLAGTLSTRVISDFGKEVSEKVHQLDLEQGERLVIQQNLNELPPGFYAVNLIFESAFDNKQITFNLGVQPEAIVSPLDQPEDFQDYWDRARRELNAVAPQFKMTRIDSLTTPKKETYLVEMRSLGNILVRGWYHKPIASGKHPAMLEVQGYSSSKQPENGYKEGDMACFVLNIRGHGNSQDHVNPGFPGYLLHHIEDKELYIYRGAYMDCLRALDFLYSRPEVDTTRVAVLGGSQGGALSIATAALAPERVALCAPSVPFLSDFRDYFKVGTWPAGEFVNYVEAHPEVGWEKVYKTLSYIDIKNLAPLVKVPVFMGVGLLDPVCPPHINFCRLQSTHSP
ncbi:MAG: acetylxylan esterase [Phaeodactylibacter sp.]|nr:acetylxylan esterase [Phaeodactylibacter sp.]